MPAKRIQSLAHEGSTFNFLAFSWIYILQHFFTFQVKRTHSFAYQDLCTGLFIHTKKYVNVEWVENFVILLYWKKKRTLNQLINNKSRRNLCPTYSAWWVLFSVDFLFFQTSQNPHRERSCIVLLDQPKPWYKISCTTDLTSYTNSYLPKFHAFPLSLWLSSFGPHFCFFLFSVMLPVTHFHFLRFIFSAYNFSLVLLSLRTHYIVSWCILQSLLIIELLLYHQHNLLSSSEHGM